MHSVHSTGGVWAEEGDKGSICGWGCGVWCICQAHIMARWAIIWDQAATLSENVQQFCI